MSETSDDKEKTKSLTWKQALGAILFFSVLYFYTEHQESILVEGIKNNPIFHVAVITGTRGSYKHPPGVDYEYFAGGETCEGFDLSVCYRSLSPTDRLNGMRLGILYDALEPCNSIVLRDYQQLVQYTSDSMARALNVPDELRCD